MAMSQNTLSAGSAPTTVSRALALGFLYWLTFLLVLEPGNVAGAMDSGNRLDWVQEILRILGASLLGAAVTPVLLEQVRRFPVEGVHWRRRAVLQIAACGIVAAVLVAISCILADWFLRSEHRPIGLALVQELISNGLLVAFSIAGFVALLHAVRFLRQAQNPKSELSFPAFISIQTRGRLTRLDVRDIDWIEAQGNYLALHAGDAVHLLRDSMARMETRLDPACFIRIHRRTIVAVDRVREVAPLAAGDATVFLKNGAELRLSRTYHDRVAALTSG
jgi:hypothetical protein